MNCRKPISLLLVMVSALMLASLPAWGQLSGAIFTSSASNPGNNSNLYPNKGDVYLSGGPVNANCTGAGLPDGNYYFQITEPNGSPLTVNAIGDRLFTVVGGVVVAAPGRLTVVGKCGSPSIGFQLMPYNTTTNNGCEYKVWATRVGDYSTGSGVNGFLPSTSKTDNFKVCEGGGTPPTNPPPQGLITGVKYYDANVNGNLDSGEVGILGWQININPAAVAGPTTCTQSNGVYEFAVLSNGLYTISEVIPTPGAVVWLPTTALSGQVNYLGSSLPGPNFGNVCLGPGGGKTLGFWSNKNGQAMTTQEMVDALRLSYTLRNFDGSEFDPQTKAQLPPWLLAGNATNMANMLSVQMAAMVLNVMSGGVSGSANVYAGAAPTGCSVAGLSTTGFIAVNALIAAANASLFANANTTSPHQQRPCQEFMKNALDNANNNKNFVQATPCAVLTCPYAVVP